MAEKEKKIELNKESFGRFKKRIVFVLNYAKAHRIAIVLFTILGMSGALVGLLGSLVSRDLVDIITGHRTGELIKTFVMLIVVQLVIVGINNLSGFISTKISVRVENEIKGDIYEKIMKTEWEELTKFHSGELVSRWMGDSAGIANGLLNTVPNIFIYSFRFLSALYLVLKNDYTFAIFVIVSVPLSLLVSRTNMKRMQKFNMNTMQINAKMSAFSQDSFSNIQNVKAFDMIRLYMKRLKELQKETVDAKITFQKISIMNSIILTLVSQLVTYSTYGWGVYRVWSGVISYGSLTMFLALSQSLSGTAQNLINIVPGTITLTNAAQRIMDILDLPKENYEDEERIAAFATKNIENGIGVRIANVSFTYQTGTKVFENANFEAHPREVVGLIGPSGEGKTTMLRLLLSIIQAKKGKAELVTGEEAIRLSAAARQVFAYVPQGNSMFAGTIAENMRNVKEDATDEEIIHALKLACAYDFVERLPDGINSEVKEHGGGFSEGQSQRLSIARALLRNSPILLLDEATSALDNETAAKVLKNITSDSRPRTCIVTTHRNEVMEICDRIYRIQGGAVMDERK